MFLTYNLFRKNKMKKILFLLAASVLFASCQQDIQTNTPALQAQKDYKLWRSKDTRVSLSPSGELEITSFSGYETVIMKTALNAVGTYVLGTTNINNYVSYTLDKTQTDNNTDRVYSTSVVNGPVYSVSGLLSNGLNYLNESIVQTTTSGSGNGLRLKVLTNVNGSVSSVQIASRGINYKSGDIVYLVGGDNNAAVQVVNVQQSNGVIVIEKIENGKYTGKFNFNAVDATGEVVTFSEGVFYKVPLGL